MMGGSGRWGAPEGRPNAPLLVVARDFGAVEEYRGVPLQGPSGKLTNKAMARAGLSRSDALLTNVANVRPPRDEWRAHAPGDIERGMAELRNTLRNSTPRLIVAMGNEALRAVVLDDPRAKFVGIEEARGYVFESAYGPVLATIHPAAVTRQWVPWWACFTWDWQKASRLLAGVPAAVRTEHIIQTRADAVTFVEAALRAPLLAVDSETNGSGYDTIPDCVAFSHDPAVGVTFPLSDWTRPFVAELLASPVPKVLQNLQFDVTVFERNGLPVTNAVHDIMLAWHAKEPLLAGKQKEGQRTEKNLRFLVSLLVDGQAFYKDYNFATPEERWRLCAIDARCTLEIAHKLL